MSGGGRVRCYESMRYMARQNAVGITFVRCKPLYFSEIEGFAFGS